MKAIIYARFSPRRNAENCESIEAQTEACRAYAKSHNLAVAAEFGDKALSGSEEDRPGLWAAIDALGKGDVLLVYRLDRLARSVYLSFIIEQAVHKNQGSILSVSGEGTWQDAPEDQLVRHILQALAEYERKVIGARTKMAMLRHQRNGRRMSHLPPYGWAVDPQDADRLVECKQEQQVIETVVALRKQGLGFRAIAKQLEAMKAPKREAKIWSHARVVGILRRAGVP